MFQIAKCKYPFNLSVKIQSLHLLDVWHLDKAHKFTLWGVRVGLVEKKSPTLVIFDLHRFGRVQKVKITQDKELGVTVVDTGNSQLQFTIEEIPDSTSHYLHVVLLSNRPSLILLWPLIQLVFWLTVLEDYLYYDDSRN